MFMPIKVAGYPSTWEKFQETNNLRKTFSIKLPELISNNEIQNIKIKKKENNVDLKRKNLVDYQNEFRNKADNVKMHFNSCQCCLGKLHEQAVFSRLLNSHLSSCMKSSMAPVLPQHALMTSQSKMNCQSEDEIKISQEFNKMLSNENSKYTGQASSQIKKNHNYFSKNNNVKYIMPQSKNNGFERISPRHSKMSTSSQISKFNLPELIPNHFNKNYKNIKPKYLNPSKKILLNKILKNIKKNSQKNETMNQIKKRMREGRFGVLESLAGFRQRFKKERRLSFEISDISLTKPPEGVKNFEEMKIETECSSPLPRIVKSPASLDFSVSSSSFFFSAPSITTSLPNSTLSSSSSYSSSFSSSPNTFFEEHDYRIPLKKRKTKYLKDVSENEVTINIISKCFIPNKFK